MTNRFIVKLLIFFTGESRRLSLHGGPRVAPIVLDMLSTLHVSTPSFLRIFPLWSAMNTPGHKQAIAVCRC